MDELVQAVVCHNSRPFIFHGYLAPFFILQAAVYYYTTFMNEQTSESSNSNNNVTEISANSSDVDAIEERARIRHSYEIGVIAIAVSIAAQIITYLFCHWSVDVKCWLNYSRCRDPYQARFAKVIPTPNNGSTELVPLRKETIAKKQTVSFVFQKTKYVYNDDKHQFMMVEFQHNRKIGYYKNTKGYTDNNEMQLIERQYGRNELEMVIPEFKELFIERATAPFFVFQVFCVGLWSLDEFFYYALFTLFMLVTFEVVLVKHQLRNMQEIRRMGNQPTTVQVFRQSKWKPIRSDHLIPGDLVNIVRSDHNIPCDILLIRGSCIIDESTLTGESVPQMKESIEDLDDEDRNLDINSDRLHVIYGGTRVLQHTPTGKDPGCLGYVLRTGFHTSQGKLLRTILFGVKRVTANNFETFCFIMFLLFFAVISAYYVWSKGIEDPKRSRYRLFFECTLIVTSVVPPELPIELSLAVNTSLLSLSKLYIYCTEPFRIPFAGKVIYCCFDKTGTLTSDDLVVEGIAGAPKSEEGDYKDEDEKSVKEGIQELSGINKFTSVIPVDKAPISTQQVLASCHSLAHLDDKLVGDPLEKRILQAVNCNYSKSGIVTLKKGRGQPLRIHQRFHFNSTLKRMSVIASFKLDMSNENVYICTAKGAPEFMKPLMKNLPEDYDKVYLQMSRQGARVLALGYRTLGALSSQELSSKKREDIECDLMFAGFILISCPLKPDSKAVSLELSRSNHRLIMITGDGALTACHVASLLTFTDKEVLILTKEPSNDGHPDRWIWTSTDQLIKIDFEDFSSNIESLVRKHDLCLTGESLEFITREKKERVIFEIVSRVKVFARVSPKQKEIIITTLKSRGDSVLMCGDGTNDVGALKHAHVGVALLPSVPQPVMKPRELIDDLDGPRFVKLGDASIAAPFTSRLSSTNCISHIIKQGRCTLVTTLQMFKILALNALLSAYCHSVLYLDGIKFSDCQVTVQGLLTTLSFLFITRSQPLNTLSAQRPWPNIFNFYTIITVTLQFAVHFVSLIFLYNQARLLEPTPSSTSAELESTNDVGLLQNISTEFKPSLVSSTVFVIWISVQVATFVVNYKGHPFMQDLRSNRPLCHSFIGSILFVFSCVLGLWPWLNSTMSIVEFPIEFQPIVLGTIVVDFGLAYTIDRLCEYVSQLLR